MPSLQRENKKYLSLVFLALLVIAGYFLFNKYWSGPDREIASRCTNYSATQPGLIDCFGVISIYDAWDVDYLSIDDHVHNYELARIADLKDYSVSGDKLYVKNQHVIEGSVSDGKVVQYYQELFQNGQLETHYYPGKSDIPAYLVIHYKTGEVVAYKTLEEVPLSERAYFGGSAFSR